MEEEEEMEENEKGVMLGWGRLWGRVAHGGRLVL